MNKTQAQLLVLKAQRSTLAFLRSPESTTEVAEAALAEERKLNVRIRHLEAELPTENHATAASATAA